LCLAPSRCASLIFTAPFSSSFSIPSPYRSYPASTFTPETQRRRDGNSELRPSSVTHPVPAYVLINKITAKENVTSRTRSGPDSLDRDGNLGTLPSWRDAGTYLFGRDYSDEIAYPLVDVDISSAPRNIHTMMMASSGCDGRSTALCCLLLYLRNCEVAWI
jgi:hypothetical protein